MFNLIAKFLRQFRTIKKIDQFSSMERLGRDEYKYIEGDHVLKVQIEMLSGTTKRVIYSRTIKNWMPPYEQEIITEEKKKEILRKMCKYFEMNQISYAVE